MHLWYGAVSGTVTGIDCIDPEWQRRYGDHVVPAVRRAKVLISTIDCRCGS
jgi:hypothetical protein